jgi:hypothetical protein
MMVNGWEGCMPQEDDLREEDVDLTGVPKPKGATMYASTTLEQNSRGLNVKCTAFVTYTPPEDMSLRRAADIHTQLHQLVLANSWRRAEERKLAYQTGTDTPIEQFEVDLLTGEIT